MAAAPLSLSAQQSLYVNGTAYVEPGTAVYSATSTARPALTVNGAGGAGSYTGSNITLSSTIASGEGQYGAYAYSSGTINLRGATISTEGASGNGFRLFNGSKGSLENVTISTLGASAHAVYLGNTSTATLANVNITTAGGYGLVAQNTSMLTVTGGTISTSANDAGGASLESSSTGAFTNVVIQTAGAGARGIGANAATLSVSGGTISTVNGGGIYLENASTGAISGARISLAEGNTTAQNRYGVYATGSSSATVRDVAIVTGGSSGMHGFVATNGGSLDLERVSVSTESYVGNGVATENATLTIKDSSFSTAGVNSYGVSIDQRSTATLENVNVQTTGFNGQGMRVLNGSTMTATGGTITVHGDSTSIQIANNSAATLNNVSIKTFGSEGNGVTVNGVGALATLNNVNITTTGEKAFGVVMTSSGTASGTNTLVINGGVINTGAGSPAIGINASLMDMDNVSEYPNFTNPPGGENVDYDITITNGVTLTGGTAAIWVKSILTGTNSSGDIVSFDRRTVANIHVDNSAIIGDINTDHNATVTVDLKDNSTLTGNINGGDGSTLTVNLSNSSTMAGDITTSGTGAIALNMTNHTRYDGNITHGGGALALNLAADSHGRGNWQHGNLNMDNTSSWTFTDTNSIIDNLHNDGQINLEVNTDTGEGTHLTVTGSATGNGTVHVNTEGDGKGNPNDILGGLVTGPGTGDWHWDNVDWGLEQLVVTPGADGTLSVSKNGKSSTVSALTTGLITAQKGSWFAQQNSLLKRMGDLRLLNDAYTQTLAGKDDKSVTLSADKLIENIWIRGYGQQLNYSADVTGRGFKQYIYGTDIGTDHKFTLNNSNTLYTGVFAGYGAANTDHRYNGSESNLHNYYAGLYASLLNNNGWYIDATLKAQYSDHELKGYHGGIDYFNAKYNNWSVGGSIELGKQFKFQDDWFIEPQLQANYVHILASDYSVSNGQQLNVSDLDAFQLRAGVVAGRTLKLKNGGALQPYVKISGVEMLSTGGKITSGYQSQRPNLDGARAELGAGIIWQLDNHNQLHLDYEASCGDKYDKPWGLTAGYRYQF
jgi:outer membrane autotransporter protein